jgi:hypothetical protein
VSTRSRSVTHQLRATGGLTAATCALMVLGLPLMILLLLDPSSQAACAGTPTGPGPASVPGIPDNLLRSSRAPCSSMG